MGRVQNNWFWPVTITFFLVAVSTAFVLATLVFRDNIGNTHFNSTYLSSRNLIQQHSQLAHEKELIRREGKLLRLERELSQKEANLREISRELQRNISGLQIYLSGFKLSDSPVNDITNLVEDEFPTLMGGENVSDLPFDQTTQLSSHKNKSLINKINIKKRRMIFSINPGRTGSEYLARVLDTAKNVRCFHEKEPVVVHFPEVLQKGLEATTPERSSKLKAVLQDLTEEPFRTEPNQIYCDTSHMFVKSWADVVLDHFFSVEEDGRWEVDVIVLRRYLPLTLRSFMRLDTWHPNLPLNEYSGGEYSLGHRNFAIVPPYALNHQQDKVDLALGYIIDFEAQAKKFSENYPQVRMHEIRLEQIQTGDGVRKMLEDLGLEPTQRTLEVINKSSNQKFKPDSVELKTYQPLGLYYNRVKLFEKKYRDKGLRLPPLPHMSLTSWCEDFTGRVDPHGSLCPEPDHNLNENAEIPFNILPHN